MKALFLDTETTGLDPRTTRLVEIAIVDEDGQTLLNTLLDPGMPIPIEATAIHGIHDGDVAGRPKLMEVLPCVLALVRNRKVVIYNAAYDTQFIPFLKNEAASVECAMLAAQTAMGLQRWPRLTVAAEWAGYQWLGKAHRALADTLACRHVWQKIRSAP